MKSSQQAELREHLSEKKDELNARLNRISANLRRRLEANSKERAKELEDQDVVDTLGSRARLELAQIGETLERIATGDYGRCVMCGGKIENARLSACPYALKCIECMGLKESFTLGGEKLSR